MAGPGEDETVLCVRQGPRIHSMQSWTEADPRGKVLAALAPHRNHLTAIKVDSIGQGHYFARHLEDNGYQGKVEDVNVGRVSEGFREVRQLEG